MPYVLPPIDPHLRRWMLFVDGENFTIRAQELAKDQGISLREGPEFQNNVFIWLPGLKAIGALVNEYRAPIKLQPHSERSYYYTSVQGDEKKVESVKEALWSLGFQAEVFKKSKSKKAKGVDIALTKDLLVHAFFNHYDVAVLIAGDGDYVPLVSEAKRLGKIVYLMFFHSKAMSPELRRSSDMFFDISELFIQRWRPAPHRLR